MVVGTDFIYDAFSKTMLRCFCSTCQVSSIAEKKRPPAASTSCVVRPPVKVDFLASEVRYTEQSKGGIKYELVLSEAADDAPKLSSPAKNNISIEEIQNKLRAAEERKQSLEAKRLSFISEQLCHLNEVKGKKEEFNNNFIEATRESLQQKMECNKENREAYLKSIQEKVRDHVMKVEEVKKMGDTPPRKDEVLEGLKKKLEAAALYREEQMNALLDRLRDHDNHICEVRKQMETAAKNLKERHAKKLETAQEKREALWKEIQERSKEHEKHIADAKKQMEERIDILRERQNKKLEIAKEKREAMIKETQDKIMEHKSHVLEVRQMNIINQQDVDNKLQQISKKLVEAESKRLTHLQAKQEKLHEHDRHAEEVRKKAKENACNNINKNSSG